MTDFIKIAKPLEQLTPFVEYFWRGSINAEAKETISMQMVPHARVELIIHLNDLHCELTNPHGWVQTPDYMMIGLLTKPMPVRFIGRVEVFAIRFKPDALYNIFGVPASEFSERFEDMALVLPKDFQDFCHRMKEEKSMNRLVSKAENYLLKCLSQNNYRFSYVNKAAELIRRSAAMKIENITDQVFISERQLERGFKEKVGISPKQYMRISRINKALKLLMQHKKYDLTSIAYHCGYFDQAHFIKDFKNITGQSPSIFMKRRNEYFVSPV